MYYPTDHKVLPSNYKSGYNWTQKYCLPDRKSWVLTDYATKILLPDRPQKYYLSDHKAAIIGPLPIMEPKTCYPTGRPIIKVISG